MQQQEIILLTGASGFFGSHLVKGFLNDGYRIFAYKRKSSDLWRLKDVVEQVEWFDAGDLRKPFEVAKINHVVHTSTCYGRSGELASEVVAVNLLFPLMVFELATFFNSDTFLNTDTILNKSLNFYSLSKSHFCDWLMQLAKNTKVINVKLEHIYGPFDDNKKFISYVIEQCAHNVKELPLTLGEQKRDFVYVDDVVSAYKCILKNHKQLVHNYNHIEVGSGQSVRVRDVVEFVAKHLNSKTKLLFGALPYRESEIMDSFVDLQWLKSLGWSPQYSFEKGLKEIFKLYDMSKKA
jgi:CDP-paratose synthetase